MVSERLFKPLRLGNVELSHRIVLAPLTRFRADEGHVPTAEVKEYYAQRASCPGTLLITEAAFISPRASGYNNAPGIWSPSQISAWREVTDAVHAQKSFIYLQLWALGRRALPESLAREEGGPYPVVSASAVPQGPVAATHHVPHALTVDEIRQYTRDYATAAKNAVAAGFDGVEIHGANAYLIDQFLSSVVNQRTDEYGGSIENRSRFALEVAKAVVDAVGDSKRVAIRLSPWTDFEGVRVEDPVPQHLHVISELKKLDLAYLHLVESRTSGEVANAEYLTLSQRNDPFVTLWGSQAPLILAGGFMPDTASKVVDERYPENDICIAFGRYYISNPDLPFRIKRGLEFSPYDRSTFYSGGAKGYTDYPFSPAYKEVGKL